MRILSGNYLVESRDLYKLIDDCVENWAPNDVNFVSGFEFSCGGGNSTN